MADGRKCRHGRKKSTNKRWTEKRRKKNGEKSSKTRVSEARVTDKGERIDSLTLKSHNKNASSFNINNTKNVRCSLQLPQSHNANPSNLLASSNSSIHLDCDNSDILLENFGEQRYNLLAGGSTHYFGESETCAIESQLLKCASNDRQSSDSCATNETNSESCDISEVVSIKNVNINSCSSEMHSIGLNREKRKSVQRRGGNANVNVTISNCTCMEDNCTCMLQNETCESRKIEADSERQQRLKEDRRVESKKTCPLNKVNSSAVNGKYVLKKSNITVDQSCACEESGNESQTIDSANNVCRSSNSGATNKTISENCNISEDISIKNVNINICSSEMHSVGLNREKKKSVQKKGGNGNANVNVTISNCTCMDDNFSCMTYESFDKNVNTASSEKCRETTYRDLLSDFGVSKETIPDETVLTQQNEAGETPTSKKRVHRKIKTSSTTSSQRFTRGNKVSMDPKKVKLRDRKKLNRQKRFRKKMASHRDHSYSQSSSISTDKPETLTENDIPPVVASEVVEAQSAYALDENRICNVKFFLSELQRVHAEHNPFNNCPFQHFLLIGHEDFGLQCRLDFACTLCNIKKSVFLTDDDQITKKSILGTITTGNPYATAKESLASVNVPYVAESDYIRIRESLFTTIAEVALESMEEAAEIERKMAIERGDVINGIPCITVVVDGSWLIRSYGSHSQRSPSGCAVIIGLHSKRVLFIGVRNKYCSTCSLAERRGKTPRPHTCYKNWDTDAPSGAMESDIIVEGFNCSVQDHKLYYKKMVGDGDSNVHFKILESNPYGDDILVEKVECVNHLFRNLCKRLRQVPERKNLGRIPKERELVRNKIMKLRKCAIEACKARKSEGGDLATRINNLQEDMRIIPYHAFNDHSRCQDLSSCTCLYPDPQKNVVEQLKNAGLFEPIVEIFANFRHHAKSLLIHETNNLAECFNSVVCKMVGGKRVHFGKKESYYSRVLAAVIQFNSKQVLTDVMRKFPNPVCEVANKLEKQRQAKLKANNERRRRNKLLGKKERRRMPVNTAAAGKVYGQNANKPDKTAEEYEKDKKMYINELKARQADRVNIERKTVKQSSTGDWFEYRRTMITASKVGQICRVIKPESLHNIVKEIVYPQLMQPDFTKLTKRFSKQVAAMKWGIDHERDAKNALIRDKQWPIVDCGFFIDPEFEFIGGSPDGLINDDEILEIKSPYNARFMTISEGMKNNKVTNLKSYLNEDLKSLKPTHKYHYQAQLNMRVTGRRNCRFVVWTTKDYIIINVPYDEDFVLNEIIPVAKVFHELGITPEVVNREIEKGRRLKNLRVVFDAMKSAKNNKRKRSGENADCKGKTSSKKRKTDDFSDSKNTKRPAKETKAAKGTSKRTRVDLTGENVKVTTSEENDDDSEQVAREVREGVKNYMLNKINERITWQSVQNNVLSTDITGQLNDNAIDRFLQLLNKKLDSLNVLSCLLLDAPEHVPPCDRDTEDIQILGGIDGLRHWRCYHYDKNYLNIYDSWEPNQSHTYADLHHNEKVYISKRYPFLTIDRIRFRRVRSFQPDGYACGIFAAAFATMIVFGYDPCMMQLNLDVNALRAHFMSILRNHDLELFPCIQDDSSDESEFDDIYGDDIYDIFDDVSEDEV